MKVLYFILIKNQKKKKKIRKKAELILRNKASKVTKKATNLSLHMFHN